MCRSTLTNARILERINTMEGFQSYAKRWAALRAVFFLILTIAYTLVYTLAFQNVKNTPAWVNGILLAGIITSAVSFLASLLLSCKFSLMKARLLLLALVARMGVNLAAVGIYITLGAQYSDVIGWSIATYVGLSVADFIVFMIYLGKAMQVYTLMKAFNRLNIHQEQVKAADIAEP